MAANRGDTLGRNLSRRYPLKTGMRSTEKNQPRLRLAELLSHSAMGAALGLILVLLMVSSGGHHVFDMVVNSAAPELTMAALVAVFTLLFGVGATLTGLLFIITDAHTDYRPDAIAAISVPIRHDSDRGAGRRATFARGTKSRELGRACAMAS
jgi:hypothetical protein